MVIKWLLCCVGMAVEAGLFYVVAVLFFGQTVPVWGYILAASIGWESVRAYLYTHPLED